MTKLIDLSTIIGVYGLTNTGAVLVHAIDYDAEKVLASVNGADPCWCDLIEACPEGGDDAEIGFYIGALFIPLSGVMRFYNGGSE